MMSEVLNVLVVVDVQDCFMSNLLNNDNFLNFGIGQEVDKKLELSAVMVKKIAQLSAKNDIVVFTRDMHPINHISFEGDEGRPPNPPAGYWPHHCRTDKTCGKRTEAADTEGNIRESSKQLTSVEKIKNGNPKIEEMLDTYKASKLANEVMVKGNQLSYFFYFTPELADTVLQLNDPTKKAISLNTDVQDATPDFGQVDYTSVTPIKEKFYSLFKGERCNFESYSAFNYHLKYDTTRDENLEEERWIWDQAQKKIPIKESNKNDTEYKYTTGLFEFIINYLKDKSNTTVNFNICGLVGDVCVMHTAVQGSLLWEKIYKTMPNISIANCNFNVELAATAFLGPGGYKPTQAGYYENTSDKNAALEEYKNFYKSETKGYVDNVDDAKYNFVLNGEDQSNLSDNTLHPVPTEEEPPTEEKPLTEEQLGGSKRTRRNRKFSMHKKHKQNCKCKFCLYGGGKRKSMKKRRQTKKRRQRK